MTASEPTIEDIINNHEAIKAVEKQVMNLKQTQKDMLIAYAASKGIKPGLIFHTGGKEYSVYTLRDFSYYETRPNVILANFYKRSNKKGMPPLIELPLEEVGIDTKAYKFQPMT